jgi:hypothetical protein
MTFGPGTRKCPRPRNMIFRVLVLLVIGAIINVAVAWGCAACLNPTNWPQGPFGITAARSDNDRWDCCFNRMPGAEARMYCASVGLDVQSLSNGKTDPPLASLRAPWEAREKLDDSTDSIFDARGLPLLCMWSRLDRNSRGDTWTNGIQTGLSKSMIQNGGSFSVCLPLHPIWAGFAINTIFYASMLWLLFAYSCSLRRSNRVRRGQCPACAYPINHGTTNVCSECGAAFTHESLNSPAAFRAITFTSGLGP